MTAGMTVSASGAAVAASDGGVLVEGNPCCPDTTSEPFDDVDPVMHMERANHDIC